MSTAKKQIDMYFAIYKIIGMTKDILIKKQIKDILERLKIAKTWQKRANRLKKRKENTLNEKDFCKKYGINYYSFHRAKKGKIIPSWKAVEIIEKAFDIERV